jgi:hypothetical protein
MQVAQLFRWVPGSGWLNAETVPFHAFGDPPSPPVVVHPLSAGRVATSGIIVSKLDSAAWTDLV